MWNLFSPYSLIDTSNPVFQQELRRLHWLKTPQRLRNYNQIVWIGIPAVILAWWLIERVSLKFKSVPQDSAVMLPNAVLVFSVGLMILSSFYVVVTTIARIHQQFHFGEWETLRMTHQYRGNILAAKDAIAQLQAWPFIALEIALRASCFAIYILNIFYRSYHSNLDMSTFIQDTVFNPASLFFFVLIFAIGFAFIFEPVLRMRVLVSWSTAIAIQIRNLSLALLSGFGAVFVFHFTQLGLVASLWNLLNDWGNDSEGGAIAIVCIFVPVALFAAFIFYFLYIAVRKLSVKFIYNRAFASD